MISIYFILKKNKFLLKKINLCLFIKKKHAILLIKVVWLEKKDQYSLVNLTYFSCGLEVNDKKNCEYFIRFFRK